MSGTRLEQRRLFQTSTFIYEGNQIIVQRNKQSAQVFDRLFAAIQRIQSLGFRITGMRSWIGAITSFAVVVSITQLLTRLSPSFHESHSPAKKNLLARGEMSSAVLYP